MSKIVQPLILNKLRILCRGNIVYEQPFHEGVNIIRGLNGSGKSTIADFIFFILGGEFDDWKDAASRCDEVHAEIETAVGKLTLRRVTESKTAPVEVFFGNIEKANNSALEGWHRFPIRRNKGKESFSQVLFRSLNIPETTSEGSANITMHQLLRLAYSDQRTPASRLFRYESFDTQAIRAAVGDLICGISGYEVYESNLRLRSLEKDLVDASQRLSGLLKALPRDNSLQTVMSIASAISDLTIERKALEQEIQFVDDHIVSGETKQYLSERSLAQKKIAKEREKLFSLDETMSDLKLEIKDIFDFRVYLKDLFSKLNLSEASLRAFGSIDFVHCPGCGQALEHHTPELCSVCRRKTNPEEELSRYNQIRLDLEIQIRESKQLLEQKESEHLDAKNQLRLLRSVHEKSFSEFEMKYSGSNGPRESFLAERTSRIGHINAEIKFLTNNLSIAEEVDKLSEQKAELQVAVDNARQLNQELSKSAGKRRSKALGSISDIAVSFLRADFKRQDEFEVATRVDLNFENDAISVDGKLNFAESSNVFLKNTAILSTFLAALSDDDFFHPRFLLLDNIEDKGMEEARSHLFQKLIVERSTEMEKPFQIIFTTSMMNPELELEDYVIGDSYTKEVKTLNFNAEPSEVESPNQ
jgi:hypothetical protein